MSIKFDMRPAPLEAARQPRSIAFSKMEGAGNDYIYIEVFETELSDPGPLAIKMSDRHFGVGGDGIILMGHPSSEYKGKADFRMRIFNADGSEGDMCGNATRCVGKYLFDKGLTDKDVILLETKSGVRILYLNIRDGAVASVRVDMGEPLIKPELVPIKAPGYEGAESFINGEISVNGTVYRGTAVNTGNPHFVIPFDGLENLDIASLGPKLENHEFFPRRANIEFIEVKSRQHIRMRVWERGSGETMACGTGASASLVACVLNGWTERKALVELRGGSLEIEWSEEDNRVYMTGPAAFVFSGTFMP